MAAVPRTLDSRWIRRYRLFFIIGSIILSIQVFLAYKFFSINASGDNSDQERFDPSGKGKIYFEFAGQNEDPNGAASSRRVKDDDEDSPSNSNAVNSIDNKHKVPPDKTLSVGAQGHEPSKSGSNRTSLRLEELDFVPICDVYTKEAISAIHRAKTQRCKQHLVNITCLIQSGQLYPKKLQSFCPAPGFTAGKSLGCFKDEKTFRLLSGYYANLKTTNSPQQCINMCLQSGFPYAGVEYSSECFCGNDAPPSPARLPDSSCNMKCPVDVKQACGGYLALSAYHTGVARWTPAVTRDAPASTNLTETPVRIVYLLTLNGRAVRQVRRLVKLLFHTQHYFYIHVDTRQDYLFRELLSLEQIFPDNVRLTRQRSATIWGGASLLSVLLRSMKEILQLPWSWDFIINLSESDLPVKTNTQLVQFLTYNKNHNFVKSHGREVQRFIAKQGLDKTFVECDNHMWRVGDRVLPWGLVIDGGSDWVALGRPLVKLVTSSEPLVTNLLVLFQHTLLPAESFFHTVLRNSELCSTYVDNNLHVTNWKRKLGCKCQYKHVVDWCGCSPNDFRLEDWPRVQGTENRQLFFARKFEPIINQAVINRLDQWLYGPYPPSMSSLDSYWQSTYHYADLSPPSDDAVVSLATSMARRVAKNVGLVAKHGCVEEVTAYFHEDQYQGSLVRFVATNPDGVAFTVESWVQYQSDTTQVDGHDSRIKFLMVSSDFDVKEQLSLNWLSILGPLSEPILMWGCRPIQSAPLNVTALWVDPTGSLVDVTSIHLDADPLVGHVRPMLPEPLLPGIWEVKLVYNTQLVASTRFLIIPLSSMAGVPLTAKQAGVIHKTSTAAYTSQAEWDVFLPSQSERNALLRRTTLNARRYGEDLSEWIDSLTSRFYRVVSSCVVSNVTQLGLAICESTGWSSLVPDPKSHIGHVNRTSSRLDRW